MNDEDVETISSPRDKARLMARIADEWAALMDVVNTLTPQQMTHADAGGWSPKDNLAHLAAWERWLVRHHLGGESAHDVLGLDEETFSRLDETGLNAFLFERSKDTPVNIVLEDLHETHRQTLARLDELSFTDLLAARYADDPEERPVLDWVIGNTYDHYQEHCRTIEAIARS